MPPLLNRRLPGVTRRRFLAGGLALGVGLPAYARTVEPGWLKMRRLNLPGAGPNPARPLRFAHFTDIHFKGREERLREAVEAVNRLAPDFACFTGDLVEDAGHVEPALRLLSGIRCPLYGVPGNHDHWADVDFDRYREMFAATGG
ncbi:MAG: metallophosphoesterase, partial [Verrucomicrobiota bacterium]